MSWRTRSLQRVASALVAIIMGSLCSVSHASESPFYVLTTVARIDGAAPAGTFTAIDSHCSINEQNNIAFIGEDRSGRGIFFSEGGAAPTLVAHGNFLSVWLNNADQIATVFEATSSGNHVASVRRYSRQGNVWTSTTVAKAGNAMYPGGATSGTF